ELGVYGGYLLLELLHTQLTLLQPIGGICRRTGYGVAEPLPHRRHIRYLGGVIGVGFLLNLQQPSPVATYRPQFLVWFCRGLHTLEVVEGGPRTGGIEPPIRLVPYRRSALSGDPFAVRLHLYPFIWPYFHLHRSLLCVRG